MQNSLFEDLIPKYQFEQKGRFIKVVDENIKNQIRKTKLSPSMVNSFLSSEADYILNKYLLPEIEDKPTMHLEHGKWYHSIMERFFCLNPEERTLSKLKECTLLTTKEQYPHLLELEDSKEWIKSALRGYWDNFGHLANTEKVATIFLNGSKKLGLETFVNGKIGNCKRQCVGFIDRILEGKDGLIVDDWKTGKHLANFNPTKKISENNSFEYHRQQTFYALLLANKGIFVKSAQLTFPLSDPPTVIKVDIHNDFIKKQTIADFEEAERKLEKCIENDFTFELKKGKYNGWTTLLTGEGNAFKPSVREDLLIERLKVNEEA